MIKIVFSEVASPTSKEDAIDLGRTTCVRAINTLKACVTIHILGEDEKSITLGGGETILLKKGLDSKVYSSSNSVRISGVSIY